MTEKMKKRVQRRKNRQKRGTPFFSLPVDGTSHVSLGWLYSLKGMSVDDFLGASFMEEDEDKDVSL